MFGGKRCFNNLLDGISEKWLVRFKIILARFLIFENRKKLNIEYE
jgi:hypothetical protein